MTEIVNSLKYHTTLRLLVKERALNTMVVWEMNLKSKVRENMTEEITKR